MKASEILKELSDRLQPLVDEIESKEALTENYYGDYLGLLGRIIDTKGEQDARLTAMALAFTTANKKGVLSACEILNLV